MRRRPAAQLSPGVAEIVLGRLPRDAQDERDPLRLLALRQESQALEFARGQSFAWAFLGRRRRILCRSIHSTTIVHNGLYLETKTAIASPTRTNDKSFMQGFGERIRGRARDLKLTDGELARRLGIDPSRLGKYVRDEREPDLTMLLKICATLDIGLDQLLLPLSPATAPARDHLISRIVSSCRSMGDSELEMIARIIDAAADGRGAAGSDQPS